MIEIPLVSDPSQEFSIDIQEVAYEFTVKYNSRSSQWSFSIATKNESLIENIVVAGGVNLLAPYNFSLLNMFAINIDDSLLDADVNNLGSSVKLIILESSDINV